MHLNSLEKQKMVLGLLGHPLSHSFSPSYFKAKFEAIGCEAYNYLLFDFPDLKMIRKKLSDVEGLRGFNVTIPYKQNIMSFLDEVDEEAVKVGAVNTVLIKNGIWKGFNTDVKGIENSLSEYLSLRGKALILGNGGASKAANFVLRKHQWQVEIWDGNQLRNPEICSEKDLSNYDLFIQATPLGMFPNVESCPPLNYQSMTPEQIAFDMVYNPEKTIFLARSSEAGAKTIGGLPMLYAQAEEAWRIWTT